MMTNLNRLDKTAMTTAAQEIARKALQLSEEDRQYVIEVLSNSISREVDPEIEEAWRLEFERRIKDVDEGKVELIPADNLIEDMRRWIDEEVAGSDRTSSKKGA